MLKVDSRSSTSTKTLGGNHLSKMTTAAADGQNNDYQGSKQQLEQNND